jgi:hypothetical protein
VRLSALLDMLSNGFSASVVTINENGKADIEFYLGIDADEQRETYTRRAIGKVHWHGPSCRLAAEVRL